VLINVNKCCLLTFRMSLINRKIEHVRVRESISVC
jgi:hypothetical protein